MGIPARIREGALELWPAATARAALSSARIAVGLELELQADLVPLVCDLSPELAARLVDRVLGGDGEVAHSPTEPIDDVSAGVLGYLAARLCAASGAALRTRTILTNACDAHARLGHERVVVWPLALELGGQHVSWLRVFIPEASARRCVRVATDGPPARAWLRGLRLQLCAHAARITLRRSQLCALAPGDVIVPERSDLVCRDGHFEGRAELHVFGARHGAWRCEARDRHLVLDAPQPLNPEYQMSETRRIDAPLQPVSAELAELAIDAPIELCVELARFTLPLEELCALRPGQVLGTTCAIGQSVTLRAAGRAVARGELVDLEGEIGVRILELARD
jgi:type III secretion system YscQ/HrcQ family protein